MTKRKTEQEIRDKINEYQKRLILIQQQKQNKRIALRERIKILYWDLGELSDEELE